MGLYVSENHHQCFGTFLVYFILPSSSKTITFLARLITSYPKFEAAKYGINPENIVSLLIHEIHNRGWRKISRFTEPLFNPQYMIFELFDRHASRHLTNQSDIFVGLSGCFPLFSAAGSPDGGKNGLGARFEPHAVPAKDIGRGIWQTRHENTKWCIPRSWSGN